MKLVEPIIITVACEQPMWKKTVKGIIDAGTMLDEHLDMALNGVLMGFVGQVHDSKSKFHLNEVLIAFCQYANSVGYVRHGRAPYNRIQVIHNRKSYTTDKSQVVVSKHDYNVKNDPISYSCYLYDGDTRIGKYETPYGQRWCSSMSETVLHVKDQLERDMEDGFPYIVR